MSESPHSVTLAHISYKQLNSFFSPHGLHTDRDYVVGLFVQGVAGLIDKAGNVTPQIGGHFPLVGVLPLGGDVVINLPVQNLPGLLDRYVTLDEYLHRDLGQNYKAVLTNLQVQVWGTVQIPDRETSRSAGNSYPRNGYAEWAEADPMLGA